MNSENKDQSSKSSVYDELKGFFPPEYDLSPEELEGSPDTDSFEENEFSPIWEDLNNIAEPEPSEIQFAGPEIQIAEPEIQIAEPEINKENETDAATTPSEPSKLSKFLSDAFDILEVFTLCTACIILIFSLFVRLTIVEGQSMDNTLHEGQFLMISDLNYTPSRGDIVVLQNTNLAHEELKKPLVKRIIAVGGEKVDISEDGQVTITDKSGNAELINQDYIKNEAYRKAPGHYEVPAGSVFVMGDNRNNSTDSRDSRVGFIDERCIIGRAFFRVLPLSNISIFQNPYEKD